MLLGRDIIDLCSPEAMERVVHTNLPNHNILIGRRLEYGDVVEEDTMFNKMEKDKELLVTENAVLDGNNNDLFDIKRWLLWLQ